MKYYYLFLFSLFFSNSFSQDIIVKKDGELIRSKVSKITPENIEYNKHDNLKGPLYVMPINDIDKIDFENGAVENFSSAFGNEEISMEDLKELIIENIDKHAYIRSGKYNYVAKFQGDDIKLILQESGTKELGSYKLYDFSGECDFHDLSVRKNGVSYINVIVNEYNNKFIKGDTTRRFTRYSEKELTKLVILVKGHDEAKVIYDALKKYNQSFKQT